MRRFSPLILSILRMSESASLHATEADCHSHEDPLSDPAFEQSAAALTGK